MKRSVEEAVRRHNWWKRLSRVSIVVSLLVLLTGITGIIDSFNQSLVLRRVFPATLLGVGLIVWRSRRSTSTLSVGIDEHYEERKAQTERLLSEGEFLKAARRFRSLRKSLDDIEEQTGTARIQGLIDTKRSEFSEFESEVESQVEQGRRVSDTIDEVSDSIAAAGAAYDEGEYNTALDRLDGVDSSVEEIEETIPQLRWSPSDHNSISHPVVEAYWKERLRICVTAGSDRLCDSNQLGENEQAIEAAHRATEHFENALQIAETYSLGLESIDFEQVPVSRPELTDVEGVGPSRSTRLKAHGIETPSALVRATSLTHIDEFGERTEELLRRDAREVIHEILNDLIEQAHQRESELRGTVETKVDDELDTAEQKVESAAAHLEGTPESIDFEQVRDNLNAARQALESTAEKSEPLDTDRRNRRQKLTARVDSVEETLEGKKTFHEFEVAVENVEAQLNAGVSALEDCNHSSAMGHFGRAKQELNAAKTTANDLETGDVNERIRDLEERLEVATLETQRSKDEAACREEMVGAEAAVSQAIQLYGDSAFDDALEQFNQAREHLQKANERASRSDLDEEWEIKRRLEEVKEYCSDARTELEAYREKRVAEVAQHLDRAEQLVSKGRQHLDVDDGTAANESCTTAEDALGNAKAILREEEFADDELETRASEIADEVADLRSTIEDANVVVGGRSKRELVESLQELAVSFDESPREAFIRAYGTNPVDEYTETFGSWNAALKSANLEPVDEQARGRRKYDRVDILDAIRELATKLRKVPSETDMNDHGEMSASTVEKRFGSWETAIEMADLPELPDTNPDEDPISELTSVSGVTEQDAILLVDAGFHSVHDLATASREELAEITGLSEQLAMRIKADVGTATSTISD